MSQILSELLERMRNEYIKEMESTSPAYPYLTAHRVAHRVLSLPAEDLAKLIANDSKLLAARAGKLIDDPVEISNPSVGAIITANLVSAGLEGLLHIATSRAWMEVDEAGIAQIDVTELDQLQPIAGVNYAESTTDFVARSGRTELSKIFNAAELAYEKQLDQSPHDAYQLALHVAADHAIFAPDDLAPLIVENILLLGLRDDKLVSEDLFDGDPPAGMILSAHLTEMLVQQLVEKAIELGALGYDSEGQPLFDDLDTDEPVVH